MEIKLNVKRKFTVNGKEYGSVEEMPSGVREAYEKARGTSGRVAAKIVINGQEYPSIEALPPDVRQVYDKVMSAAETGDVPSEVLSGTEFAAMARGRGGKSVARSHNTPRPIEPESILSFSPRTLIVGLALLILLLGLYYYISAR